MKKLLENYNFGLDKSIDSTVMGEVASYAASIRELTTSQRITEAVKAGAKEAIPDAITSLFVGLFQQKAETQHDCTALNMNEGLQEKAKDASMTVMNADVNSALDFADGF